MSAGLIPIPVGAAPGLDRRWQEMHASGAEYGTAAPRLRDLADVSLRAGSIFADAAFTERLRSRHRRLGADPSSMASIEALAGGAACVVTGQQPHLLTGPFYTAWKILGAVSLARRLSGLRGRPVVPVYWCGSDDSDFDEVSSAWLFDAANGPWRLHMDPAEHEAGMQVGPTGSGRIAALEEAALVGLRGPGVQWLSAHAPRIPDTGLADRAAAWVLRFFADSGIVVLDARDDVLAGQARPILERYVGMRGEVEVAVAERAREREAEGWPAALADAARASGVFAIRDGRRVKLSPEELESGSELRWSWGPSVLLRAVVQDALLAPVAAVLGPGELAYHAEIAPVYDLLGVEAARPAPRPHLTLTGASWGWPADGDAAAIGNLLGGGRAGVEELTRLGLPARARSAFETFSSDLDNALIHLGSALGHDIDTRSRARFERELRRLRSAEVDRGGGHVRLRAEWLARGHVPQERLYSCWLLWAWCADPAARVLEPLGRAWVEAVDRAGPVQWALPLEEIR